MIATAAGNRAAFKALYDATNRRLYGVALLIMRRRDAAEDVLQDAYVRVWVEARRYDPERGQVMPWLCRVVRNLAIDHLRLHQRTVGDDILDYTEALAAPAVPIAEQTDLSRGLSRLCPDQRESVDLALIQGYTHEELALHLGVPLGTAKSRVRRGLLQLRLYLEATGPGLQKIA